MTAEAALVRLRAGDAEGALNLLDAASGDDADPARHAARGMTLLDMNQPEAASFALRTAVSLGDTSPPTLLNLAIAEDRLGNLARARGLMETVAHVLPNWDEPLLRLAESYRAANDPAAAEAAYRRLLEVNPRREEALVALAGLLIARAEGAEARVLLLRCLGIAPDRAEAWATLGLALLLTAEPALAHTALIEAQRLEPAVAEYALHGIEAARVAGTAEAELARLTLASEADPLNPVPLLARGVLLERLGRRPEAIDALEVAAALAPDALLPVKLLGAVLARSDRRREAEAALRRASELDPDDARLHNDRATVLMRMQRHAEASTLLLRLIEQHGDDPLVLSNLSNATACLGLQEAAVGFARRAIELDPDASLPRRALCNNLPYRDGITGAALLTALRACAERLPRTRLGSCANDRDPERKLTVGLLSGSLKTHPVGWLTVAGIETLDPARFAVVCLAQNAAPTDPIARRFRAAARDWIDIDALDDVALATRARDLGIDVLIDLGGYGDAARMPACAHRLAPVQVKWVGMQNHSTGLPEIDWFITDRWETPPELEHVYSEQLLRLPDGYVCYSPPTYAPDVGPLPALANRHITFGCFNNLAKVTPRVIATWAAVLRRLPDARLVLKTHQFHDRPTADRVRAAFAGEAVDTARIELRGSSPHRAFMAEYGQIDIVLDPFPYSGGLTTCEALWMGVPTVTLPGEIFASRHSMSHLSNVGLSDWVARDASDYVDLAVAKAMDVAALAALRAGLRPRVKASPLCDAPRFGRNLGGALRHAWRAWCAS
ncbi:MAG: tetratricopeptide repeat protein [Acetobacteraceae bacterium]|jgi:predicted O-linked N-acetylglucosamine transferase (SPINDLY family)